MTSRPTLDRFLTYRLHRLSRISDRDTGAAYAAECGLNLGEARCLAAIGSFQPLSLKDLAQAANQDKGHASRSAQGLVALGLVRKQASPLDARGIELTLTRAGRARYARVMHLIGRRNEETFAALDASEQRLFGELLDRVDESLRRAAGETSSPSRDEASGA